MKYKKIESNWLYEAELETSDLKEGDTIVFEMGPSCDWNTSSDRKIHKTPVIFYEQGIPCIDFDFFDKYFWGSRYIRVEQNKTQLC